MIVCVEVVAVMRETERNDPFMKKMNKLLAMILAAAMSIGMLSGCSSKEEPAPAPEAEVEAEPAPAEEQKQEEVGSISKDDWDILEKIFIRKMK